MVTYIIWIFVVQTSLLWKVGVMYYALARYVDVTPHHFT
jgi:hypothetical protein